MFAPMAQEYDFQYGQETENQVWPVELVDRGGGDEEVAEHDHLHGASDQVYQELETQELIDLLGHEVQVGVYPSQNVQLKMKWLYFGVIQ